MIADFTAQAGLLWWVLVPALLSVGVALFAFVEPELAEVYLGDWQILFATVALVAIVVVIVSLHAPAPRALGFAAVGG
jgi:uncharacterized membrane protein YccC